MHRREKWILNESRRLKRQSSRKCLIKIQYVLLWICEQISSIVNLALILMQENMASVKVYWQCRGSVTKSHLESCADKKKSVLVKFNVTYSHVLVFDIFKTIERNPILLIICFYIYKINLIMKYIVLVLDVRKCHQV